MKPPQRRFGGTFYMDFIPTLVKAHFCLGQIPYVEKYTNPISTKTEELKQTLVSNDVKIRVGSYSNYWEDRGEVVQEATISYPQVDIEYTVDYRAKNIILPMIKLLAEACHLLPEITAANMYVYGTDYRDNFIQLAEYRYDPDSNMGNLREQMLSQRMWDEILKWSENRCEDTSMDDNNVCFSKHLIGSPMMAYTTDYSLICRKARAPLCIRFYPVTCRTTSFFDFWHKRQSLEAVEIMNGYISNN